MKYLDGYACPFGIQRLCFESSLSISDWAAWVQAIGSVLAIAAGFAFILLQERFARERRRMAALEEHSDAIQLIAEVVDECESLIKQAMSGWQDMQSGKEELRRLAAQLGEDRRTLLSLIEHDVHSARLRTLLRDASDHLDGTKQGVVGCIVNLSLGKPVMLGATPPELGQRAIASLAAAREALRTYDERRRIQLLKLAGRS